MSYSSNEGSRRRFFIITHLGGLMVVSAFIIMYVFAGTGTLSEWNDLSLPMGPLLSSAVMVMLFLGFGTKLGLIPFHIWMPDIYADAPTHTTSLLSTVSSGAAVLILFKSVFGSMGIAEDAYVFAIALLVLSSASMIWAAIQSLVQSEPKRILAYSSMGNMALVVLSFSLGMLFAAEGLSAMAAIAFVAGIFHTINHSVFKSLIVLTVGTIEDSTGETRIERMGGLARMLPFFSMISLIAVLSMAAVPPFNGFASEWIMIQSFLGGETTSMRGMAMVLPIGVAVLGTCGMMVAVSYARMYGIIFSGRPRSDAFSRPKRVSPVTLIPLSVLAGLCVLMGLFAGPVMDILADGVGSITSVMPSEEYNIIVNTLDLPKLAGILLVLMLFLFVLNRVFRRHTKKGATWDCGTELEGHMQYSSLGFTQPLVKVFHPLYDDMMEIIDVDNKKKFSVRLEEPFVTYLYRPIVSVVMKASKFVSRMQSGNIQMYLGYILVVSVVLLLVVRVLW
jgi:formate hydrogenlyase subunit 3/multisubunit Na+/H+ antiporter MnhD subunit